MIMAKFSMLKKKYLSPSEALMIIIIHLLTTSLVHTNGAAINRSYNKCLVEEYKDLIISIIAISFSQTSRTTAKTDTKVKFKRNNVCHYSRSYATKNLPHVRNLPPTVRTPIATMIQQLRSYRVKRCHQACPKGSNIR